MRYFLNKSKEKVLQEIRDDVSIRLYNDTSPIGSGGQMGAVLSTLTDAIENAITAGFKTLLDSSTPESELDDILLKDDK